MQENTITNSYSGANLNVFKGVWKHRFREVASRLKFRLENDSGDNNQWQTLISDKLKAEKKSSSSATTSTATSTATGTKSSKSVHNNPISTDDKKCAIDYLKSLPAEDKWRLKSGRFVEDVVKQAINDSAFEVPCLSFVVDLADPIWPIYFSPEEVDELGAYNAIKLPELQGEIQSCINLYDNSTLKTAADYYEFASDQKLKFGDSFEKRWIK